MTKYILYGVLALAVLAGGFFAFNAYIYQEKQAEPALTPKDASYLVDGTVVRLKDGVHEEKTKDGSSGVVTRYFGNEVEKDLDGDGREDVAFLLTQELSGSRVYYYVVAALNKETGYEGSQALYLGDRIAPQTTGSADGKQIVVNYVARGDWEPASTPPSVAKSLYLLLDPESMQFGEVVQNFEGEADASKMTLYGATWAWVKTTDASGRETLPKQADKFVLSFGNGGSFSATTDCNRIGGSYKTDGAKISFSELISTKMYCEGSEEAVFAAVLGSAESHAFTGRAELVLTLRGGGTATFRVAQERKSATY